MTLISAKPTYFSKRVFPLIWYAFLAFFVIESVSNGSYRQSPLTVVFPFVMAVIGYVLMKRLVWGLADEVLDCGDHLLVRNAGIEESVALSNIMNVSASTNTNPARIALRLVNPGRLGAEIVFIPKSRFQWNPFAKNQVAEDLITRVYRARQNRTG